MTQGFTADARRVFAWLECTWSVKPISDDDMRRAQQLRQAWCAARFLWHNHAPTGTDGGQPFVLVVSQT